MGRNAQYDEARRAATREQLLQAALRCFAENGFANTSIAAVARRAKLSKGLLYHYFDNKDALVEAVLQRRLDHIAAITAAIPDDLPPAQRLRRTAHALVEAVDRDPDGYRLYLRALADPALAAVVARLQPADRTGPLQALLAQLGSTDPALDARFFQVTLLGISAHRALSPAPTPLYSLVERLLRTVLPGGAP